MKEDTFQKSLPRILYVSDVPVELSYAGATLMYRLLEHYPKEKLLIVQGTGMNPEQRIPGVQYHTMRQKLERFRFTRLAKYTKGLLLAAHFFPPRKIKRIVRSFRPDVVLTVSIRLMWLIAYRVSKTEKIPLHVILHDDWLTTENYGLWQKFLSAQFAGMYRHATARFCISPAMEAYYRALYGVKGTVIYPLRGKEDHIYPVKQSRKGALKFCYAGSLFTGDFAPMLNEISKFIGQQDGELHIFSHRNKAELVKYVHLTAPHVFFHGLIPPSLLRQKMNEEMDVAVLLNSFRYEEPFRYNFSSKLVDYTTAGLPVLFWGPASSGSIAWALSINYDAIVTGSNTKHVERLLDKFKDDNVRSALANQLQGYGTSIFSYERNYNTFKENVRLNNA
jgi:hypothetical protein